MKTDDFLINTVSSLVFLYSFCYQKTKCAQIDKKQFHWKILKNQENKTLENGDSCNFRRWNFPYIKFIRTNLSFFFVIILRLRFSEKTNVQKKFNFFIIWKRENCIFHWNEWNWWKQNTRIHPTEFFISSGLFWSIN